MANFKRKGPKSTRSGCLMCKPWKHQSCTHRANDKRKALDFENEAQRSAERVASIMTRWPHGTVSPRSDKA